MSLTLSLKTWRRSEVEADLDDDFSRSDVSVHDTEASILEAYNKSMAVPEIQDPIQKRMLQYYRDNLNLLKMYVTCAKEDISSITKELSNLKDKTRAHLDHALPPLTMIQIHKRLQAESTTQESVKGLESRIQTLEANQALILKNQQTMMGMLQQLLNTPSVPQTLNARPAPLVDANKKREKSCVVEESQTTKGRN